MPRIEEPSRCSPPLQSTHERELLRTSPRLC
jgi:hypothetical protein